MITAISSVNQNGSKTNVTKQTSQILFKGNPLEGNVLKPKKEIIKGWGAYLKKLVGRVGDFIEKFLDFTGG